MTQQATLAVILSDIHIGDDAGIVAPGPRQGYVSMSGAFVREELPRLLGAAQTAVDGQGAKIRYLILNGDVWDTAVRAVAVVSELAANFFRAAHFDKYFDEIVFLPGNHDHHLWQLLQTETCILRPLEKQRLGGASPGGVTVRPFPQSQPGFLDLPSGELDIPGVGKPYVGNVFVSALTGGTLPVNVVYPNLYVRVRSGAGAETTLVTHGHFFELAWCLLSELVAPVLDARRITLDLVTLEMLNSPLTEFINFSLAQQEGRLAEIVSSIYDAARAGRAIPELAELRERLVTVLDELLIGAQTGAILHFVRDKLFELLAWYLTKQLAGKAQDATSADPDRPGPSLARWDPSFLERPTARRRMGSYVAMSGTDSGAAPIKRLVFGHTHVAFPGTTQSFPGTGAVEVWNTGGWVPPAGKPCSILALALARDGTLRAL